MAETERLFGGRVRAIRQGRKLSQQKLAEQLGMHYTSLAKLETATRRVTLDEAVRIAAVLRVPLGDLLNDPSVSPKVQRLREELTTAVADEMRWRAEEDLAFERKAFAEEQIELAVHERMQAEQRVTELRAALSEVEEEERDGKSRKTQRSR